MIRLGGRFWVSLVLLLSLCSAARAEEQPLPLRLAVLASQHADEQPTLEATRALLAELRVALVIENVPREVELSAATKRARTVARADEALAVVWFVRRERAVIVYFYEPRQDRLLTRRVDVSESEAAAAEEVALIVRSAVAAALEGSEVMMTEVRVPETKPTPPTPPVVQASPPRIPVREHARLSAGYVATLVSTDAPLQHGASFTATALPTSRARVAFGFVLTPAFEVESGAVNIRLRRYPVTLSGGFEFGRGALRMIPELAVTAEFVKRDTLRTAPTLEAESASSRWLWAAGTHLRGEYRLAPGVQAYAFLGAEIVMNPHDEVSLDASRTETLLAWAAIRPLAAAGVSVQIW